MPRDGSATRAALLDAAEALVFERGLAGTGVDAILAAAGSSKGAFFHHFPTKQALADALIERWAASDARILDETMARAEQLSTDPLQQLLVFHGLLIEDAERLDHPEPGCLFGALCYQEGLLDSATQQRIRIAMQRWQIRLRAKLDEIAAGHPPRLDTDLDALAHQVTVAYEGAFIVSRTLGDATILAGQLRLVRDQIRLLFGA